MALIRWCSNESGGRSLPDRWNTVYRVADRLPHRVQPHIAPVQVWLAAPCDAHAAAVQPWLSPAERERLRTMQHPRARAEFLSGRWLLRGLLSAWTGIEPAAVPLNLGDDGALTMPGGPSVNLSHTDGLVAVALATHGEIGVDVEWHRRPGRTVELAHRYFAPAELDALLQLPEVAPYLGAETRRDRFFRLWTLKEAWIKARGLGLKIPLASFAFRFTPDVNNLTSCQTIAIATTPAAGDARSGWRFAEAQPGPEHRLALAWHP